MLKILRKLPFFLCSAMFCSNQLFAQAGDVQFDDKSDPQSKEMDALRRWLRDKRFVTMKEIGGDLSFSGDVRAKFQAVNERLNGIQQRDNPSLVPGKYNTPKPMYAWDVEFNLVLDYRTERTWASAKLEFDNDMGLRSGTVNSIRLERAYLGGRIMPGDTLTIDAEIGRRYLINVFDSKLEFGSLFDGVLFRFSKAFDSIGDYYFNTGAFLIDDTTNHYGMIGEMGALAIANTGMNIKYSLVDWYRPGGQNISGNTALETALTNQRYRFLVSQLLAYYQMYPEWINKKLIKIYGAALTNHFAVRSLVVDGRQIIPTGGEKANWAAYFGVSIGVVKKQGDWALNADYQCVQAQAYPSFDNIGIGRGNAAGSGLYTVKADGSGGPTTQATAGGNTNFQGFELDGLYAVTDNLVVQQNFKYSNTLNKNIGPNEKLRQYKIEFVYGF